MSRVVELVGSRGALSVVHLEGRASFEGTSLELRAALRNDGDRAIYVLDRPFRLDEKSKFVADVHAPYRFVMDGVLRLLLGNPPRPGRETFVPMRPFATKLGPGASRPVAFAISSPVKEYNPYCLERASTRFADVEVRSVELLVQFVTERKDLLVTPGAWPDTFEVHPSGVLGQARTDEWAAATAALPFDIRVARRTDGDFARLTLALTP
jgi:hypothetical protein